MALTNSVNDFDIARGQAQPFEPITAYLARQAQRDEPAFTFIDYSTDRHGAPHTLSWSELNDRVRTVAAAVGEATDPGQRVAILAGQDLDYVVSFLGALRAGVIAVPLFAPEVSMHQNRLVGALADCSAEVWLTSEGALDGVRQLADDQPVPHPKQIITVDSLEHRSGAGTGQADIDLDRPAYLQYTSGSTRNPAGAVISHRAIVTNAWQAHRAYGIDQSFTCTGWIPFFHDMGLVQLLCLPVFTGARAVFTTPMSFIRKPSRWLRQLSDYPNTMSAAPNFAYEYAVRKISEEDRATLDLSGVRVLINGSEPVRSSTINAFAETFRQCGLRPEAHRPSYGLAEATVFVTAARARGPVMITADRAALGDGRLVPADGADGVELVSAGVPTGQHVRIVDTERHTAQPDGAVGEIWINGPNVADGYWQAPERSADMFEAELRDATDVPARGWLRTGDLGVVHDGELYITGRMKDLIIIDGKNHYPQDIESTVHSAHPAIRPDHVAAFPVESNDREAIVVIAELGRHAEQEELDSTQVAGAVRKAVTARHEVKLHDLVLVPAGSVLRTSSGKIARAANKKRYLAELSPSAGA
ncbi:MAG: AMP-binding protein [Pseudonocardiaceae bacterium]|nr:AMP-binding protein [Pseudonocardiaceae bacterium]